MKRRPDFWLLFLASALLRIVLAFQPGLWVDEIFSLAMATGHSLEHRAADADPHWGDYIEPSSAEPPSIFRRFMQHDTPPAGPERVIRAVLLSDTNPPLYYLLLSFWTQLAGTSDAALRFFSTVWALACFPLVWSLAHKVGGRRTAWTACVFFAFSPSALYYSAEGRMYSLVWFLTLCLARSTLSLAERAPTARLLLLWILSAAAGLLTHYFFAFVLFANLVWLFLHPGNISRLHLMTGTVAVGLIVLPWYLQLPESLTGWRVTGGWLDHPLTGAEIVTAPLRLAWSFLSGLGVWGGVLWADLCAAGLYLLLIFITLRHGAGRLLFKSRQMVLLWVLAAVFGPWVVDLLRNTNASLFARYALPGLPAGLLLAAMAISRFPRRANIGFILLILLFWLPGLRDVFAASPRRWEPFTEIGLRLSAWSKPSDLIIVHSIPSGVLGVARYMTTSTPIASWVVQLGQRRVPDDVERLLNGRRRVALVKIHDMGKPSPAEAWFRGHTRLDREDKLYNFSEILYFLSDSPNDQSASASGLE